MTLDAFDLWVALMTVSALAGLLLGPARQQANGCKSSQTDAAKRSDSAKHHLY